MCDSDNEISFKYQLDISHSGMVWDVMSVNVNVFQTISRVEDNMIVVFSSRLYS